MTETFRVKLRVKRFKFQDSTEWQQKLNEQYRKAASDMWKDLPHDPPLVVKSGCPRCGMKWDGAMSYCCPEGQMCGIPRGQEPRLYPYISTTVPNAWAGVPVLISGISTPHDPRYQLWN